MGLLTSMVANQFRDNPLSMGDMLADRYGVPRQQANVQPQSTTIDYNEDGTVKVSEKKTINRDGQEEQIEINRSIPQQPIQPQMPMPQGPAPMGAVAPDVPDQPIQNIDQQVLAAQMRGTPTPVAPVAPQMPQQPQQQMQPQMPVPQRPVAPQQPQPQDTTFNRMVQQESGGRQFNPQGGILTSPKGAQGIAQIMPETAANPGYGIAPATPQEIATKEGNLAFGQRYYEGMNKHFGGDHEKAAAAYNAGPQRVEQAIKQAEAKGGVWKDYLPDETQKYLANVFPRGADHLKRFEPIIAGGTTASDAYMTPTEQAIHHMALNSGDVKTLGTGAYAQEGTLDPATRRAYNDAHADQLRRQSAETQAQKDLASYVSDPTGAGGLKLAKLMKQESEEGSYIKAYLFQRLGLKDLAQAEQQKLGAGDQWAQTMVNGQPAWVKYNGQGAPVKGYTADRELSGEDLIKAQALKGTTTHTGKMQDVTTGEIYYERTTPAGIQLVSPSGKVYTGSDANLRAYGIGSDVATKNVIQLQTIRNKIANIPLEEQAKFIGKFNAENGTNYTLDQVVNSAAPMTAGPNQAPITGAQPMPVAPVQPGATTQAQAGQMPGAPANPAQPLRPAIPGQPAPVQQAPMQPGAGPLTTPPGASQGQTPTPGIPGTKPAPRFREAGFENESPAAFEERKKLYGKEMGQVVEEVAKTKLALPKAEATAQNTLRTLDGILNHPGFSDVIGVPNVITGIWSPPGTDARNFKAKYKQLQGQEFLQAFESLKGGGSITEVEGQKATEAIAALNDPGISEEEFRRNAELLKNVIKRGINRQREMIGEKPKYDMKIAPDDKAAMEWLKTNPDDPKADAVRRKLEDKGVI